MVKKEEKVVVPESLTVPETPLANLGGPTEDPPKEEGKPSEEEVEPELKEHIISGRAVKMRQEDLDGINERLQGIEKERRGRDVSDIPLSDKYWELKKAFDLYLGSF